MQIKILIKTPKGYGQSTEKKLRPFLIGRKGKLHKIMTNAEDNKILWIVNANPRQYQNIVRNVAAYRTMIKSILSNKKVIKLAKLSDEDKKELDSMLDDQTHIDLIKENEFEEILKEFEEAKK